MFYAPAIGINNLGGVEQFISNFKSVEEFEYYLTANFFLDENDPTSNVEIFGYSDRMASYVPLMSKGK